MTATKLYLLLALCACALFAVTRSPEEEVVITNTADSGAFNNQGFPVNRFTTGEQYLSIGRPVLLHAKDKSQLSFGLSWDKSWRQGESYDAAWIFAKAKDTRGQWSPVKIEQARLKPGTIGISATLRRSSDGMGFFIYRAEDGQGDNNWIVDVAIGSDIPQESITDIKVFGLEMVHVPPGEFELGTLKSLSDRREVLTEGAGGAPYNSFYSYSSDEKDNYGGIYRVESEEPISLQPEEGNLYWTDAKIRGTNTFSGVPKGSLSAKFPKGYNGYMLMKYELSQGEYCDFLNTLTPRQQEARDISKSVEYGKSTADHRNNIRKHRGLYFTDRPDRSCNFISWKDGLAYADWAGLRHMTELEFEKACRGPEPAVYREYVWGASEIAEPENLEFAHRFSDTLNRLAQDESDILRIDGNAHLSFFSYYNLIDVCSPEGRFYDPKCKACRSFSGGDGGRGPVRRGIFGGDASGDRLLAGATYYGAMEMGGNLQEPVVTVGHPNGRRFEGTHGDGVLSTDGQATNPDWIPEDGEYAYAGRGGAWPYHQNHARTADRFKGLRQRPDRRASHIGFRGVRSD
ncbi:MAG: SUMF1/EgtB/PvdO family nonheme iron enzyme [Bacteroidota bacterium]